ncbi:hypothetical protein BLNAU_13113 [Blattamonas nauphoetae]|uniref:Uncharacterized protein n=1 Tax=Blattamonas nauphoetae TaxID=2049346 RepID=A0ABQ9XHU4_9EUKA|nr:hypothetical protein BLNAU_13113 [Blattamonas nauphoetae]
MNKIAFSTLTHTTLLTVTSPGLSLSNLDNFIPNPRQSPEYLQKIASKSLTIRNPTQQYYQQIMHDLHQSPNTPHLISHSLCRSKKPVVQSRPIPPKPRLNDNIDFISSTDQSEQRKTRSLSFHSHHITLRQISVPSFHQSSSGHSTDDGSLSASEKPDPQLVAVRPLLTRQSSFSMHGQASLFTSTPVISHAAIRSFSEAFEQEQELEAQNELLFGSDASEYEDETESEGSLSAHVEFQKIPSYELIKAIPQPVSAVVLSRTFLTFLNFNLLNMRSLAHSLFCTPAFYTTASTIPPNTICSRPSHDYSDPLKLHEPLQLNNPYSLLHWPFINEHYKASTTQTVSKHRLREIEREAMEIQNEMLKFRAHRHVHAEDSEAGAARRGPDIGHTIEIHLTKIYLTSVTRKAHLSEFDRVHRQGRQSRTIYSEYKSDSQPLTVRADTQHQNRIQPDQTGHVLVGQRIQQDRAAPNDLPTVLSARQLDECARLVHPHICSRQPLLPLRPQPVQFTRQLVVQLLSELHPQWTSVSDEMDDGSVYSDDMDDMPMPNPSRHIPINSLLFCALLKKLIESKPYLALRKPQHHHSEQAANRTQPRSRHHVDGVLDEGHADPDKQESLPPTRRCARLHSHATIEELRHWLEAEKRGMMFGELVDEFRKEVHDDATKDSEGAGRRNWKTGTASFRSSSSSSLCCPVIRCLRHTAAEGRGEEAAEHQHSHLHTTPLAEHVLSVDEVERALELFRRAEEEVVVPFMQLARREWLKCIRGSLHSPTRADCNTVLLNRVLSTATNIPLVLTAIAAYSQSLNFWEMNQTRLILLNLNASLPFFVCQHSPTSPNSHPSAVCQNASCCSFSLPPPRLFDVSLRFCAHPHDRRDAAVRRLARRVGGQLCGLEDQSSSSHHHHPAVPSHHVLPLGRRRQRRFPSHHRQPRPPHSTRTSQAHLVASAC